VRKKTNKDVAQCEHNVAEAAERLVAAMKAYHLALEDDRARPANSTLISAMAIAVMLQRTRAQLCDAEWTLYMRVEDLECARKRSS